MTNKLPILFLLFLSFTTGTIGQDLKSDEIRFLIPNKEIKTELKVGEKHSYRLILKKGDYFHVEVEQIGIDVALLIINSEGKVILERDRPNGLNGQESLSFISLKNEGLQFHVASSPQAAVSGEYIIRSSRPRAPTIKDKQRAEAEKLFQNALGLAQERKTESDMQARVKAKASATLWQYTGDKYAEALTYTVLGYVEENSGQREEAIKVYERALLLYRQVNNQEGKASSLSRLCLLNALLLNPDTALAQYREVKMIYRALKDSVGENEVRTELTTIAEAYLETGRGFFQQGETGYVNALKVFKIAQVLYRELEDAENEAFASVALGRINDDLGEKEIALVYYNNALPFYQNADDKSGVATILNNVGSVYSDLGEKQKALEQYEHALRLWSPESKSSIAATLVNIGTVWDDLGEKLKALDYYEKQALPIYVEIGEKSGMAMTFDSIGSVYSALGEKRKALEYYEKRALPLWKELKSNSGIATTLTNIGSVYSTLGEKYTALDYYEKQALPLFIESGKKSDIATTLNNIGRLYSDLGEKQKALGYYKDQALPLYTEVGNLTGIATTLTNIGSIYSALGEKRKALDYCERQALPLWKKSGRKSGIAATLNNIGDIYDELGDKQKALDYYEKQALPIYRSSQEKAGIAVTLNNIGSVYFDLGDFRKALDYFENQALPLWKGVEDKTGIATTFNNIGRVYSALGEKRKALYYYEDQALPLWKQVESISGEATILNNIMVVWDDLKNPRLAILYGKRSVNLLQKLRDKNLGLDKDFQKTFLKSVESSYRYLATLLIERERLPEAHQTLNAFKDQQQFDFDRLATKGFSLALTPREIYFDSGFEAIGNRIGGIKRQIEILKIKIGYQEPNQEDSRTLHNLEDHLKVARDEYLALTRQSENEFNQKPDAVRDKEPYIADTGKMQSILRDIGSKTIVIYTLVGKDRLYSLIVTADEMAVVSSAPITGDRLNNKAKQLWALLQSEEYDPKYLSKEIYGIVFRPIEDKLISEDKLEKVLPPGATILWSLDGNLRYLPVASLYDGEKYLIERYNNIVFTRGDSERWTQAVSSNWTGIGLGTARGQTIEYLDRVYSFESLPSVAAELNVLFKAKNGIFDGDIVADLKFTRSAMLSSLKQRRPLVHISSHFEFSPGDEERSFLLLGDGTVFPVSEMKKYPDLFNGVELLTLSACETGAQWANSDGREVDGFAELVQRQGAASVMATLWKVRDDSSYWLLRDFYQRKQDPKKETKAEALRQAQMALIRGESKIVPLAGSINKTRKRSARSTIVKVLQGEEEYPRVNEDGVVFVQAKYAKPYHRNLSKRYAHPYFWAPFVLFGNWR